MSILKTYAVFGLGRYGRAVAEELVNNGAEVLAVDIDQNNIRPHLADTPPGDHIVILSTPKAQKTAGAGDDDGNDLPIAQIHPGVADISQPPAVADADHFLAMQVCKLGEHTQPP